MPENIHVMVGILVGGDGRLLLTQRPPGTHLAGAWEFPGGKLEPGESRRDGLERELREELGIAVNRCEPLIRFRHRYPEREVLLDVWRVEGYDGEPAGVEGQALKWVPLRDCHDAGLIPADRPILDALRLPDRYAITPPDCDDIATLAAGVGALSRLGTGLIQLRVPQAGPDELHVLAVAAVQAAGTAAILINGDPARSIPLALATGAGGIHLPARFLADFDRSFCPADFLVGASCHNAEELALAAKADATFCVLGPVLATASHPGAAVLGWPGFGELVDDASIPVYALGGMDHASLDEARRRGAQGVAGIRAFWPEDATAAR